MLGNNPAHRNLFNAGCTFLFMAVPHHPCQRLRSPLSFKTPADDIARHVLVT